MLGSAKGIKDDTVLSTKSSSWKKKPDVKRIREQVEMEFRKEREGYLKEIATLNEINTTLQHELFEESEEREKLKNELKYYQDIFYSNSFLLPEPL